jgi:hypothetical protein
MTLVKFVVPPEILMEKTALLPAGHNAFISEMFVKYSEKIVPLVLAPRESALNIGTEPPGRVSVAETIEVAWFWAH